MPFEIYFFYRINSLCCQRKIIFLLKKLGNVVDSDPSSEEEAEQTSQLKTTYLTVDSEGNDKNNKTYIPKNWREFKERDMKLLEVCDADKQSEDPLERLNQSTSELSESVNCEVFIQSDTERGLYCNTSTYSYQIDFI